MRRFASAEGVGAWLVPRSGAQHQQNLRMRFAWHTSGVCFRAAAQPIASKLRSHGLRPESKARSQADPALSKAWVRMPLCFCRRRGSVACPAIWCAAPVKPADAFYLTHRCRLISGLLRSPSRASCAPTASGQNQKPERTRSASAFGQNQKPERTRSASAFGQNQKPDRKPIRFCRRRGRELARDRAAVALDFAVAVKGALPEPHASASCSSYSFWYWPASVVFCFSSSSLPAIWKNFCSSSFKW